ncbi:MAG: hypothetical protein DIU56_010620 [Pseudomonadota bacterium]|jgi:hypothetical protein
MDARVEDRTRGESLLDEAVSYEPLLPIEKKLIGWSIGLGVALLAALVWVTRVLLPPGG